jgi:hypothetical protein
MLINLLVLLLWAPSLLGWGVASRAFLASGLCDKKELNDLNPGVAMILGFTPLVIISTFLHFFFALNSTISLATLSTGYVLLIRERRTARPALSAHSVSGALFVMMLVSLFASRPLRHFDTGLYHLQSIKWCTTYPLVRGLANLHERLAFTSGWTPASAVLNYPEFSGSVCFPITCLLLFAFGWAAYLAIWSLNNTADRVENVFLGACGCFWMWMVITDSDLAILPSLSSDAPVYFATLLGTYLCLRFSSRREYLDLFQALAITALAVTSKVSAAPLFVFLLLFGAITWARDSNRFLPEARAWIPVGVTICFSFAVWFVRSVWLSGYLVFPISSTALTFLPWHLPLPMARQLVETLQAWARSPGVSPKIALASSSWIYGWTARLFDGEFFYIILAYAVFGGLMIFLSCRSGGRIRDAVIKCWAAAAMLLAGTIYWIFTAPDPRYGYGYLFALACLVFSLGLVSLLGSRSKLAFTLVGFVSIIPLATVSDTSHFHLSGLPPLGVGPNSVRQTNQGTKVYVAEGDLRIFNAPLPSTPYFRPSLLTKIDRQHRIVEFDLPAAVSTPYYGIVPVQVQNGATQR